VDGSQHRHEYTFYFIVLQYFISHAPESIRQLKSYSKDNEYDYESNEEIDVE
jgi:hypothetical protein